MDIKRDREREIRQLLGGLTYLIFVIPNPHLIRALLEFWDPMRMVFKFVDFDLTPTIEEISGFIDLPYHECEMMVPYKPSSREFLKTLVMKSNPTLPSLNLGWIHFDFLYSRFGRNDSYYSFIDEFECSVEEWETYRLNAFAIALLGSLVFPRIRGMIDTRLGYVVRDLAQREGEPRKTLVPMILAEIMRSLSACVDGRMFFEGCNLLLQLWAIEHFYLRSDAVDNFLELESYRIQWKLHWLSTPLAIVRGDDRYFIELIGLKGVQPYTPLRVLRQFGRTQVIPLRSDMEHCKYEFGLDKPQVHIILRRWVRVLTIPMGAREALCTREYYIWILKEVKDRETMVCHTRSKDSLPSLPNENHKRKRKATNEKIMSKTIEKKHPSDELVSSLKKKIRELEEKVSDMRGWAKLLLSVDPTLETNIYKPHVTSKTTLQDNPPLTHPTSHPPPTYPISQNQPSSIQMPPKNTHFPNHPYHSYASRPPYRSMATLRLSNLHNLLNCSVPEICMCLRITSSACARDCIVPGIKLSPRLHCARDLHVPENYIICMCPILHCVRDCIEPEIVLCPILHVPEIALSANCMCPILHCARDCIEPEIALYPILHVPENYIIA
ncbi:hypothetical protein KY285_030455 [Solanum tuberosum]|nr:hypothetical protein KY285_030455 [Solanum tuberosum]